jgi:hypothetical protein
MLLTPLPGVWEVTKLHAISFIINFHTAYTRRRSINLNYMETVRGCHMGVTGRGYINNVISTHINNLDK